MSARRLLLSAMVVLSLAVSGCTSSSNDAAEQSLRALASPVKATSGPTTTTTPPPDCDPLASLRPTGTLPAPMQMPAGSFMSTIQSRGNLVVGVDQNTALFSYRDPHTGVIQGYDIDVLRQVAQAIFGDPDKITYRALTTSERINAVQAGTVDIVASLATMNCARWQLVSFSTEYYEAAQKVMVRDDGTITSISDLRGKRVCATNGSTSIDNIPEFIPGAIPIGVSARTDCLVQLEEGTVDAITADDTILFGFKKQDRNTKILDPALTTEPYGMIIAKGHPEFVRFVNAVLDRMRADGTLTDIDQKWLRDIRLGDGVRATPTPPAPRYQD